MKTILTTTLALGFIVLAGGQANAWSLFGNSCGECLTRPACETCVERTLPCGTCGPVCKYNCDYGACRSMPTYY